MIESTHELLCVFVCMPIGDHRVL